MSNEAFEVYGASGNLQMSTNAVGAPLRILRELDISNIGWRYVQRLTGWMTLNQYMATVSVPLDTGSELVALEIPDGAVFAMSITNYSGGAARLSLSTPGPTPIRGKLAVLGISRSAVNPNYGLELFDEKGNLTYTAHDHAVNVVGFMEREPALSGNISRTFGFSPGKRQLAIMATAPTGFLKPSPLDIGMAVFGCAVSRAGNTVRLGNSPVAAYESGAPRGVFFDTQAIIVEANP